MSGIKNHRGWGWIRKRGSGRHQASYLGPDGQRHYSPVTFDDKMDAEQWLAKERNLIKDSVLNGEPWRSPAERAEVSKVERELLDDYARTVIEQRNIKERTRLHYLEILDNHIKPKLGKLPIDSITPQIVRNWHAATLTDKPTMRAHAYQLLNMICNTAVKDELLTRNPCQIDGASSAKSNRQISLLTIDELRTVVDTIKPERFRALVLISALGGLRYGEVSELRRKDVKLNKKGQPEIISIERGVTHHKGCHVSTPKSGKTRTFVIPDGISADLKAHLDTFVEAGPESLLFPPVRGGCHLVERVFRDAFKAALKPIKREDVRIHDLRHFAGSAVARHANLIETMNHLGHTTSTASLRYQHVAKGREAEIATALSDMWTKPALAVVPDAGDQADDDTSDQTAASA